MDARDLIPMYHYREKTKSDLNCDNCRHMTYKSSPSAIAPLNGSMIYCSLFMYENSYRPVNDMMICDMYK